MKKTTTSQAALVSQIDLSSAIDGACEAIGQSLDQFWLLAGVSAPSEMLESNASELAGNAHARNADKPGHRWGTTRQVCRTVMRWPNAQMALRCTAAGMLEDWKSFRRFKAYKQLPDLKAP